MKQIQPSFISLHLVSLWDGGIGMNFVGFLWKLKTEYTVHRLCTHSYLESTVAHTIISPTQQWRHVARASMRIFTSWADLPSGLNVDEPQTMESIIMRWSPHSRIYHTIIIIIIIITITIMAGQIEQLATNSLLGVDIVIKSQSLETVSLCKSLETVSLSQSLETVFFLSLFLQSLYLSLLWLSLYLSLLRLSLFLSLLRLSLFPSLFISQSLETVFFSQSFETVSLSQFHETVSLSQSLETVS